MRSKFHGLAGQVERLVSTHCRHTALEPDRLTRWQSLYRGEAAQVLHRRNSILREGGVPQHIATIEQLNEWIAHARKLLLDAPDQAAAE
ncbi:hypothetical protein ACFWN5_12815 [Streptomyces sp. NPDC058430]|uniref:hypothetical protein n=1 Tax=Streptomyces sp. NPDC058430 TaxID=3346495 RepID=UPI003663CB2D